MGIGLLIICNRRCIALGMQSEMVDGQRVVPCVLFEGDLRIAQEHTRKKFNVGKISAGPPSSGRNNVSAVGQAKFSLLRSLFLSPGSFSLLLKRTKELQIVKQEPLFWSFYGNRVG